MATELSSFVSLLTSIFSSLTKNITARSTNTLKSHGPIIHGRLHSGLTAVEL